MFCLWTPKIKNPKDIEDYYRVRGLIPANMEHRLENLNARLVITNYHTFEPKILQGNKRSPFDGKVDLEGKKIDTDNKEDFAQVVKRTLGKFKSGSRVLILNDEAHHCYLPKSKSKTTDNEEADENARAAVWFSGLREITRKFKVQSVYDLSATPYYLTGSGYTPYSLFPWVVSDFGLIEAIESGLVKIPFLPESDNTQELTMPVLRNLYDHVKDELPKKGRTTAKKEANAEGKKYIEQRPNLPALVKGALDQFYNHYVEYDKGIRKHKEEKISLFSAPPVFIAVCNNTGVSKEVYKYIAGYEYQDAEDNNVTMPGAKDLFSNYDPVTNKPFKRPPTLLIDSDALENGEQINDEFKNIFASEIGEFKKDYARMHGQGSTDKISDAEILREVVNTVGQQGKLGAHIRCVVSVSMLTEGWDCLDAQTEILTDFGWKGISEISEIKNVYSMNLNTNEIELSPILKSGERNVLLNEKMMVMESQHFNIRVTQNHNFYIKYRNPRDKGNLSKSFLKLTANDLSERKSSYALPVSGNYSKGFNGVNLSDDELRFIAWFMTDGGFSNGKVCISQSKEYHNEIRSLLNRLHIDYSERIVEPGKGTYENAKPCYKFSIPKGTHKGSLARNGWITYADYIDKNVSDVLHNMTKQQFVIFWNELLKGDGEQVNANKSGCLWCCEKSQVDAYMQMAILRGFTTSYQERTTQNGKKVYRLSVREKEFIVSNPSDKRATKIEMEYPIPDEKVWCVQNNNGTLITRRNGKVVIMAIAIP